MRVMASVVCIGVEVWLKRGAQHRRLPQRWQVSPDGADSLRCPAHNQSGSCHPGARRSRLPSSVRNWKKRRPCRFLTQAIETAAPRSWPSAIALLRMQLCPELAGHALADAARVLGDVTVSCLRFLDGALHRATGRGGRTAPGPAGSARRRTAVQPRHAALSAKEASMQLHSGQSFGRT